MTWQLASQIGTLLASLVAILGVPIALVSYRRAAQARRAEWLTTLHEKFFEGDRYARIRRILDYKLEPDYSALRNAVSSGTHHDLADEFYRYLNFFEHLAALRDLGQISEKEIARLFEYDLRMLAQHQFATDVLSPQGFEGLPSLIRFASVPKKT